MEVEDSGQEVLASVGSAGSDGESNLAAFQRNVAENVDCRVASANFIQADFRKCVRFACVRVCMNVEKELARHSIARIQISGKAATALSAKET